MVTIGGDLDIATVICQAAPTDAESSFRMEIRQSPPTDGNLEPSRPASREAVSSPPPPGEPINILIVDDEPKNLTVLETILADPSYRLVRSTSANDALLALVNEEFALIVLDVNLPGMSGFELAQMVKQRKKTASIPIIFLTAYYGEEQHVLEGYATGAVDYLQKPVNSAILRSKVAVFTELHRKTRELEASNRHLVAEVAERQKIEQRMLELNGELELRVDERTSELLAANQALRESQQRLTLAQQAGQVAFWDWDLRKGEGIWTEPAWNIFDPHGPRGPVTHAQWLSWVYPEDRERVVEAVRSAEQTGQYRDEYRIGSADDQVRWVESIGAVEYAEGVPIRMRGVVRDISERKQMELELMEADRRKDEFLAMLGHELRNPLASIRNTVSIMQQIDHDNSDLRWCRDVLDRQASQLTRLVDDLLDVSRITRGKIQLQEEILDLRNVVQQAIEMSRPLINSRRHQLFVSLPDVPLTLRGDSTRLKQSVANLLNNAAKYTEESGTIWVTVEHETEPAPYSVIHVRDTGCGLDADAIRNLFDLFYQVDHNLDRADGGLGVGLSLVRTLVEMHGGSVEARSPGRGQGSEFIVRLPCLPETLPTETPPPSPAPEDAARRRILVVDDNLDSAKSLALLLKILGHQVVLAHDGLQAVEVALRERPDIILLDIGLPGQDGYQTCRSLREQGMTQQLIVALTGYGQDEDRARSAQAGFDVHLVKPVSLAEIQQILADQTIAES